MARVPAAQRREEFIAAAVRVVAAEGVDGATTRKIAAEAKAPLAALHYCFPSKEALLFAVYEKQLDVLQREYWRPRPHAGLGRTAGNLLRDVMDYYQSDAPFAQAQIELYFWVARADEELGRRAYEIFLSVLTKSLREGLRPDDDEALVDALARLIVYVSDGLVMQWIGFRDWNRTSRDMDLAIEAMQLLADDHRGLTRKSEAG